MSLARWVGGIRPNPPTLRATPLGGSMFVFAWLFWADEWYHRLGEPRGFRWLCDWFDGRALRS